MRVGETERARVAAAEAILDRGHGRPGVADFDVAKRVEIEINWALERLEEVLPADLYDIALTAMTSVKPNGEPPDAATWDEAREGEGQTTP
jgi:hypothetical protein